MNVFPKVVVAAVFLFASPIALAQNWVVVGGDPLAKKILNTWNDNSGYFTMTLSDEELKTMNDGIYAFGANDDGGEIELRMPADHGCSISMSNPDWNPGGHGRVLVIEVQGNKLVSKNEACPGDPPDPLHDDITVTCHCDPEGHPSRDYTLGKVPTPSDASKLCAQECNNDFCRNHTGHEHIKSYKCQ
ncbi:MAG: hypothetical protein R3200_12275 [Xanthomonadales bacterium]|nr:hypothetical protein [Xanthomonadales bacterium]